MQPIRFIFTHIQKNIYLYALIILFSWIFFFRFDYNTLYSWDEAWYGAIAREILQRNDWVTLHFNGVPFYDHPPIVFWIMAVFYKLFGVSEFTTRLPSVLAGVGTILLIYKLGTDLFKRKEIGFVAAMILGTCVWYVLRVRSGNLDALFLFFYVATVYTAFLTTKDFKWFSVCLALFGALVMTKTLAGISAIVIIVWFAIPYVFKSKWNIAYVVSGLLVFSLIVIPWYQYHLSTNSSFYQYHFIHIGARDKSFSIQNYMHLTWQLPLFYLHMGVRKWYYLWLITFVVVTLSTCVHLVQAIRSLIRKEHTKLWPVLHAELGLLGWNLVVLLPFLTTDLTEIWHLIPVYAPLALVVAYGMYVLINLSTAIVSYINYQPFLKIVKNQTLVAVLYILPFLFIVFLQIKTFYHEVFPSSRYVVDEVDILKKAKKYRKTVFIDRDFVPVAVFYSEQQIKEQPRYATDIETIQNFIDQSDDAVLVAKNSAVEQYLKADHTLQIHEKNNSYSIVEEPQH